MLSEKAGKFDLESFDMPDGPIMPRSIHKYDFSDPVVIQVNPFSFSSLLFCI
jgi:hypothetical protein